MSKYTSENYQHYIDNHVSGNSPANQLTFTGHYKKYPHLPLALEGLGIYHLQEHVDRPAGVNFWQWIQSVKGKGELLLNGSSYPLEEGCGILLPPNLPHVYYSVSNEWYTNFLCFHGALADNIMELLHLTDAGVYQLTQPERILDYENRIFDICLSNPIHGALDISKLLYSLLVDLSINIKKAHSSQTFTGNETVHSAICFMQEHFSESIGLSDIASHVQLSREYLCQLFKKTTNSTVLEYLTQIRLAEAKTALLKFPDKTIGDISRMCGFDTPSYFCSVFKKHEHMTPLQFCQIRK